MDFQIINERLEGCMLLAEKKKTVLMVRLVSRLLIGIFVFFFLYPGVISLGDELVPSKEMLAADRSIASEERISSDNNLVSEGKMLSDSNLVSEGKMLSDSNLVSEGKMLSDNNIISEGKASSEDSIASVTKASSTINILSNESNSSEESIVAATEEINEQVSAMPVYIVGWNENDKNLRLGFQLGRDGLCYLFLPNNADLSRVRFESDENIDIIINGRKISLSRDNGVKSIGVFNLKDKHSFSVGYVKEGVSKEYDICVKNNSSPYIFINTESGNMKSINSDKANKERGTISSFDANGNTDYAGTLKSIKGRGNSTWQAPKKPYNIKLNEKADLFGLGKAKNYCLLTNFSDQSNIRNYISLQLAKVAKCEYPIDCIHVDLYLNNVYSGLYLLTEKVEIDSERINIVNLESATEKVNEKDLSQYPEEGIRFYQPNTSKWFDIPNNPEDITGGYLMEIEMKERYMDEVSGFVTPKGQSVNLKSPEYASREQIDYISTFVKEMEEAVYSENGRNSLGRHFTDYVDIASFAKVAILQELCQNQDAMMSSFYIYKDSDKNGDGKLHAVAPWDFDLAYGNLWEGSDWSENFWVSSSADRDNFATMIMKRSETKSKIRDFWYYKYEPNVRTLINESNDYTNGAMSSIYTYIRKLSASTANNALIWETNPTKDVRTFLQKRYGYVEASMQDGCPLGLHHLVTVVSVDENDISTIENKCIDCNKSVIEIDEDNTPASEKEEADKKLKREGVENFVKRCYTKALERDAEEGGLNDWTNRIVNKEWTAEDVASTGFFHSEEFTNKNLNDSEYVKTLYRTFLDRECDTYGYSYWTTKLKLGMSRDEVLKGFSRSEEFAIIMAKYGL